MTAAPPASPDAPAPAGAEWEYELRLPDGMLAGLYHVHELQEQLYVGAIDPESTVRRPAPGPAWPGDSSLAGPWQPLDAIPELAAVIGLLGIEVRRTDERRRIAKWQKSDDTVDVDATQPSLSRLDLPAVEPPPSRGRTAIPLVIGTIILVLVLGVVGLVLAH
ncbi:MAG: hypothetical protein D6798_12205 [Deltaproteobacteria bacterium]|nr:MAG: hypothetical protein D6798_12205 [Deltaproteobacteria bacterium]